MLLTPTCSRRFSPVNPNQIPPQAQSPDESFQSLREETEAAQQDVRAYQRRNKDYMEKLKAQLGCLSARNARMNLDLSGVEKEVCKIRDRIEGKNM